MSNSESSIVAIPLHNKIFNADTKTTNPARTSINDDEGEESEFESEEEDEPHKYVSPVSRQI